MRYGANPFLYTASSIKVLTCRSPASIQHWLTMQGLRRPCSDLAEEQRSWRALECAPDILTISAKARHTQP